MTYKKICICYLLLTPSLAQGGAWPRADGQTFVSSGFAIYRDTTTDTTLREQTIFLEYGLTSQLTIGFAGLLTDRQTGEGLAFLRLPLDISDGPSVSAVEFGLGAKTPDGLAFDPVAKFGFGWGKGLNVFGSEGWLNVDAAFLREFGTSLNRFKLDSTIGISVGSRVKLLGQSFVETSASGTSITYSPSVALGFHDNTHHAILGYQDKSGVADQSGWTFGFWSEF